MHLIICPASGGRHPAPRRNPDLEAFNFSAATHTEQQEPVEISCCEGGAVCADSNIPRHPCTAAGSLQSRSSNTVVVRLAADLSPERVQVEIFDGLTQLPYFQPPTSMLSPGLRR